MDGAPSFAGDPTMNLAPAPLDVASFAAPASENAIRAFGVFRVGEALVAMPVAAVREATPARPLSTLPPTHQGLLGALTLRGDVIPVLDLRVVLGLPASGAAQAMILVVRLRGRRLLGLSADEVCGIAHSRPGAVARLDTRSHGESTLTPETLIVGDKAATVIDVERLGSLPGVPLGMERPAAAATASERGAAPMMLFRVDRAHFAVEALRVEAAAPRTEIRRNALSVDPCLGVMERRGVEIPVLCPLGALGVGPTRGVTQSDVVILRLDCGGALGFAIDQVRDIRRVPLADRLPLPRFGGGDGGAFSGLIGEEDGTQSLVIDLAALSARSDLSALARLTRDLRVEEGAPTREAQQPAAAGHAALIADRRQHLVFAAGSAFAVPLTDVREIAARPANPAPATAAAPGFVGYWRHRGAATPLFSLAGALGLPRPAAEPHVLLVDSAAGVVGFGVERLLSIEAAEWRTRPTQARQVPGDVLVRLGAGPAGRAVAWVDLPALSVTLLGG